MSVAVRVEHLGKTYAGGPKILDDLSLRIECGELFFLLGPSGCGKSTLLRLLAGLLTPDCGKIFFDDQEVTALPPEKRSAAMVFQNYALWPHLDVFENVAFAPRTRGIRGEKLRARVMDALEAVHLTDCVKRRVPSLSGGQQQRVALARAVAAAPRLLLLDEPLSNLDANLRDEMRLEIRRVCKARALTAVYVTHDRREALSIADRIALLRGGRLEQSGTPVELYRSPISVFAAGFLGDVNLFDHLPEGMTPPEEKPEGAFQFGIRPENIHFADVPGEGVLEGTVTERVFLGDQAEFRVDTGVGSILVRECPPALHEGHCFLRADNDAIMMLRKD